VRACNPRGNVLDLFVFWEFANKYKKEDAALHMMAAAKTMTVQERLKALRKVMAEKGIDAYIIPTDDYHASETVGEYFKCRKYISGFTGSAGTVVVMQDKAGLWTDGRYFLQGAMQLEGSGIDLYKMGQPGVPTIAEFLAEEIPENGVLGFDGRTVSITDARTYIDAISAKNAKLVYECDLVGEIWEERPALPFSEAWLLPMGYAGESRESKLVRVRRAIKEKGADAHVLTSLDDIAWIFNYRGYDIEDSPVILAYAYISEDKAIIFTDKEKFSPEAREVLEKSWIEFREYNDIYEYVKTVSGKVLVDDEKVNYALIGNLEMNAEVIYDENPSTLFKAIKNDTEIGHTRETHVKCGTALTKLIYWLKHKEIRGTVNEIDVSKKLEELRHEQDGYLYPCFGTLSAYGKNAAIIHYWPTEESNTTLEDKGLYLIDCGSTFMGGSTDVTRTIALGELRDIEKEHYTAVLKGHLNLGSAVFPEGMRGVNLDALARRPIWDLGYDYKHGTGHGVGYMLNCHEGPNCIRPAFAPDRGHRGVLMENMITSNEPGIYIEGSHGIRIENLILCVKETKETYEPMLRFEDLTLVPYERDAILPEKLTDEELARVNAYHKRVYEIIAPGLTAEEREWLAEVTSEITR